MIEKRECGRSAPHNTAPLHVEIAAKAIIKRCRAPTLPIGFDLHGIRGYAHAGPTGAGKELLKQGITGGQLVQSQHIVVR